MIQLRYRAVPVGTGMSSWEPVVILKTNVAVQDVYHGLGEHAFTRCGRQLSVTSAPHWRWKYDDAVWCRPCARCFPDSNQDSDFLAVATDRETGRGSEMATDRPPAKGAHSQDTRDDG